MHIRLIKRKIRIFCRRLLLFARPYISVWKEFLTKNLPIYSKFIFRIIIEFSKSLLNRIDTFRLNFEEENVDKIISSKRKFRKIRNRFLQKKNYSEKLRVLKPSKISLNIFNFNLSSSVTSLNLNKVNVKSKLDLKSIKVIYLNIFLPKLNKLIKGIIKDFYRFVENVKTVYQFINKTVHSQKFNKILIIVFVIFGLFVIEDQLDQVKITQKVRSDDQTLNISAASDTNLVFNYDYELKTKTKILKYFIQPALASGENQPQLVLTDYDGKRHNPEFVVDREGDQTFSVRIAQNKIPPGAYGASLEVYRDGVYYQQEKDFTYGVLSINTNKSTFIPGEEITLNMGALKNDGHTICDANLELKITSPSGKESNPEVKQSGFCDRDNVTNVPDYLALHKAE